MAHREVLGRASLPALGTTAHLLVTDPAALPFARAVLEAELEGIDLACSRFRDDSELARVNAAAGGPDIVVSELFAEALQAALWAARSTGGAVDPTVGRALVALGYDRDFAEVAGDDTRPPAEVRPAPGWRALGFDAERRRVRLPRGVMLDLGATAKALAADRIADRAAARTGCGVLVSLGGDISAAGPAPPGGWRIHVTDDHRAGPETVGQTLAVHGGGLATSSVTVRTWRRGAYRVHHIVDPATGDAATPFWRTVSVAAASCLNANTASTAAIVLGPSAVGWLESGRLPARLVRGDGSVVRTAGWPADDAPESVPAMASADLPGGAR